MKLTILSIIALIALSSCSNNTTPKPIFPEPYNNTFVRVRMNNPDGGSVSRTINTIVGEKDVDLSGGGTSWKKRDAIFWIEDVSEEGFILGYEIHIEQGTTTIERESKKEISFDSFNYTIDLSEGFNFTIDLEVKSEEK